MVKPSKTMQPEAVDLKKAGRAAGKAFEEDSFRNYMARKIDLQRKQFGLNLPPDPRLALAKQQASSASEAPTATTTCTFTHGSKNVSQQQTPPRTKDAISSPRNSSSNGATGTSSSASRKRKHQHVTFAATVKDNTPKRKKSKKSKKNQQGPIAHLLKKLKRRHGRGFRPKTKSTTQPQTSQIHVPPESTPTEEMKEVTMLVDETTCSQSATSTTDFTRNDSNRTLELESQVDHAAMTNCHGEHGDKNQDEVARNEDEAVQKQPPDEDSAPTPIDESDNQLPNSTEASTAVMDEKDSQHPNSTEASTSVMDEKDSDSDCEDAMNANNENAISPQQRSPRLLRDRPDLFFYGVVVQVNGYTDPDTETLQRLLLKHGGALEKYETTLVTHVIAEHLSKAKADIYKRMRRPLPVVKPAWIVDCVEAFKLLPHGDYLIDEVKDNTVQSVKAFFQPKPQERVIERENNNNQGSLSAVVKNGNHGCESPAKPETSEDKSMTAGNADSSLGQLEARDTYEQMETEESAQQEHQFEDKPIKPKAAPTTPPKQGKTDDKYINGRLRTTGTDPNFLDTFFANSRLSFIGSYKQRVQASPKKQQSENQDVGPTRRFVFHADMDCFFAAVVLRDYPQYKNKPVAISHFGKTGQSGDYQHQPMKNSSSECATCNYEARKYGIKKGMFLGRAKQLCPNLVVLPYDFEGYQTVSAQVAVILQRYASEYNGEVEAVSCDESYVQLEIPSDGCDPHCLAGDIANAIREEILMTTKCTATIGVGANKFLSKLATDRVKPNGCFVVRNHVALLRNLKLKDLHGIGYRTGPKLEEAGLVSVQDVWDLGDRVDSELSRILGQGLGKKIGAFCRGEDDRPVAAPERKTIGAECNYGVRFDGPYGVDHLIAGLAKEVQKRMEGVGVRGTRVTLKVKKRKANAKEPPKFLGHGSCHSLSKSLETSAGFTRDWKVFFEAGMTLLGELGLKSDTSQIRGMGLIISKLDNEEEDAAKNDGTNPSIKNFFTSKASTEKHACGDSHDMKGNDADLTSEKEIQETEDTRLETYCEDLEDDDFPNNFPSRSDDEEGNNQLHENPGEAEASGGIGVISFGSESEEGARDDGAVDVEHQQGAATFSDVALPPASQIHMSQVECLPSPLKKEIQSHLDRNKSKEETRQPAKSKKQKQIQSTGRFRQVDLKRMFRLQNVRNSEDFSELKHLPLDVQLQIANNDERPLGALSSFKGNAKSTTSSSRRTTTRPKETSASLPIAAGRKDPAWSEPEPGEATARTESFDDHEASTEEARVEGSGTEHDGQDDSPTTEESQDTGSWFHDNILPLKMFMDENSAGNSEALDQVVDFLCICVKEGRLQDAILLLRNIRNRRDSWCKTFGHFFMTVDDMCEQVEGYRLDGRGLGFV
ncbi:DNA polymerase IV [Seminavis robusta]|uniref:DNA repair protein REV1 n=1 Tax=Seminavis robusta TaxID=568900 RepID=A0A9N8DH26_9STRA|nr:DNA polymerase IV [Seminavis robusta]|eukprot:Sro142_g066040.1 DNA polymerase IV (1393) ;mRNA; f:6708-10969